MSYVVLRGEKSFLFSRGQRSINASVAKGKDEDEECCSDDDNEDEENQTVSLITCVNSMQGFPKDVMNFFLKKKILQKVWISLQSTWY